MKVSFIYIKTWFTCVVSCASSHFFSLILANYFEVFTFKKSFYLSMALLSLANGVIYFLSLKIYQPKCDFFSTQLSQLDASPSELKEECYKEKFSQKLFLSKIEKWQALLDLLHMGLAPAAVFILLT